jgi:two-component system, sensor histidine kinase ChiS
MLKFKLLLLSLCRVQSFLLLGLITSLSFPVNANRNSVSFKQIGTEQGLPQSTVNTIFQDKKGFIWIGTYDGLSRFDGYNFVNFKNNPQDETSLSHNIVLSIIEDSRGYIWVGTQQNGLNRLDPTTGKFKRFLSTPDDFDSLSDPQVNVVHQDSNGRIWAGTNTGLNLYLEDKQAFAYFNHNPLDNQSLPNGAVVSVINDGNNNLWVATNEHLAHFDIEQQVFKVFDQKDAPQQINTLYLDTDNSLWIGTRSQGLFHLRPDRNSFTRYHTTPENQGSISSNHIRAILRVANGDLWVGTEEGGLNIRRKGAKEFTAYTRNSADKHSLTINDIWSLYQDQSGLVWVGTAGGGINTTYAFENNLSRLTHSPLNLDGLSHEFVWAIKEDKQANIWFATLSGLDRYSPQNDQFEHFREFIDDSGRKIGNRVVALTFDQEGKVWFGNQQGQLAIFNPETRIAQTVQRDGFPRGHISYSRIRMVNMDRAGMLWVSSDDGLLKINPKRFEIIQDYQLAANGKIGSSVVRTMLQDDNGIIWFGTWDKGLQRYDPEFDSTLQLSNDPKNPDSISNNTVRHLYQDGKGNLWVATFNGLNFLSAEEIRNKTYRFKSYLEKDGLPNSAIYGIAAGEDGNIWLSTNNGISEFNPSAETFRNFTIEDGLTTNEFNGNAVTRAQNGDIYFGSVNGVSIVKPSARQNTRFQPSIQITSISAADKSNSQNKLLAKGVAYKNQTIALEHDQSNIVFEFAALDYRHPQRNQFQYRLIPYTQDWNQLSNTNRAVFTNLDPNQYIFELRATNSDGQLVEQSIQVPFVIHPPIWQTWWAYFVYLGIVFYLISRFLNKQEKTLQEQRAINEHLRRVDQLKDEFLANTSHELRTPLNGIIGIAESLQQGIAGLQNQKTLNHLQLIVDGGKRLAQLVNDILDFKKLSHSNLKLQRKAVDLSVISDVVVGLLQPLANTKKLSLNNQIKADLPLLYADEDRVQQILHNLIGNAIKYTPSGEVTISAKHNKTSVEISVKDTGIGIDDSQIELIFEPFQQAELDQTSHNHSINNRGTGLGLSVSKQLVQEHGGNLWVESMPEQGSTFHFDLPVWLENIHQQDEVISITEEQPSPQFRSSKKPVVKVVDEKLKQDKGHILIADDDPINIEVLTGLLQMNGYQVSSAPDGIEAVKLGLENKFDLAIIDIMMPGMSGYDVCQTLRQKYSPIELPILLLSARNQPGDIEAGFDAGANDYVTKPIERNVLLSRIHTMRLIGGLVNAKQQQEHANTLQQACERMGKYFPKQMVRQIITNDEHGPLVAQRKQITVLFADLAGFTAISDRFEPEAITQILNSFLAKMGLLIEAEKGVLNEILGDGLVVLFGALDGMSKQKQALAAAQLALNMQQAMDELCKQWLEAGYDHNVKLRVGIHQDYATVGNFGSDEIVAFRAVGSGVNLAARLENYAEAGEIAVSYPVYAHCRGSFEFSELTEVQFKGFNHKHRVCRLIANKQS